MSNFGTLSYIQEDDELYNTDDTINAQEITQLQKFLKNFTIEGSFEKEQLDQIKKQLSTINYKKYQGLSYIYGKLQDFLANYYDINFSNQYYKLFDKYLTPLLFPIIEQISYRLQCVIDPQSTFPNEFLVIKCQQFQNMKQEELGVQLINFDEQPYQQSIDIIRSIGELDTIYDLKNAIQQSCQNIILELKKFTTKEVDGDSFIDILMFVIIKAAPRNFLTKMYTFINNIPDELQNSEANYYASSFLVACTGICQLKQNDQTIKIQQKQMDKSLYNIQHLIPLQPFVLEILNKVGKSDYDQQEFQIIQTGIKIQGYITYICLDYLYDNEIVNKSIVIKCGCLNFANCKHIVECVCVKINDNVDYDRALYLHKKLTQFRNPFYYTQFIGKRQFSVLKSVDYLTRHNFRHILFQQSKIYESTTDLMKVALLYIFGCTKQDDQEDLQRTLVSLSSQVSLNSGLISQTNFSNKSSYETTSFNGDFTKITIVQMCNIQKSQEIFEEAYQYYFNFKITDNIYQFSMCAICRIILQILSIAPEPLVDLLQVDGILEIYSKVDQQFFNKIADLKIFYKYLSLIPSRVIIDYILQQFSDSITTIQPYDGQEMKKVKNLVLELIPKNSKQFIYQEELTCIDAQFYTPQLLQSQIQVVFLLCNSLILLTNYQEQIDIFDMVSLNNLKKQITWYQQANDLQQTGWFTVQTTQNMMIQITQQFYEEQLKLSKFSRANTE